MTANNTQTGPKFAYYRSLHDGQVVPALRFPPGYEDGHPNEYEGVDGYDPAKGDDVAKARLEADAADSRIDKSGYLAPVFANTPIATTEEPLPPVSIVYANSGVATPVPGGPEALPGKSDGGQVVVGGADRSQVRVTGEPPAPVEGTVNPADVAAVQIAANAAAADALANPAAPVTSPSAPAPDATTAPSDGLTVAQLREALDAKKIEYTSADLKADLQAKLDAAPKA